MALPALTLPSDFPPFAAGAHQFTPDPMYVPVPRQGGADRMRPLFTSVPTILETNLELSQAQLEAFYIWFEESLEAGVQPFSAEVAKIGVGTEWWKAFALSYTAQHAPGNLHTVTLRLRLVGDPQDDAPASDVMTTEIMVALSAEGLVGLSTEMSAAMSVLVYAGETSEISAALTISIYSGDTSEISVPMLAEAVA